MAEARPIPGISAADPFASAAARIVAVRAQEVADHSAGVLDTSDIENVHDMRVATRRLRAALEVFEACFPRKAHRAALREVKSLADALGERRDRDVAIASLGSFAAKLSAPDRRGVESLVEALRLEQSEANEELRPHVGAERLARLEERVGELVAEAERAARPVPEELAAARALARGSAHDGSGPAG
jgi:CHAD domain-containing protein